MNRQREALRDVMIGRCTHCGHRKEVVLMGPVRVDGMPKGWECLPKCLPKKTRGGGRR